MSAKQIAIIGGGASGMMCIIYFAKLGTEAAINLQNTTLHLIDPNGFGCGGIAYGQCAPQHILNTRRNEVSPWDTNRFKEFVLSKGRDTSDFHFDLRSDCLDFLQSELRAALAALEQLGCTIVQHTETAFLTEEGGLISVTNEKNLLIDPSLKHLPASQIIVTAGYGPNTTLVELKKYTGNGYIHSLYPYSNIGAEPALKKTPVRIAIAGSAAALYDFALAYPNNPKEATLYIFSETSERGQDIRQVNIEDTFKEVDLQPLLSIDATASAKDIETAVDTIFSQSKQNSVGADSWIAFNVMRIIASVLENTSEASATAFRHSLFFRKIKRLGGPTTDIAVKALDTFTTKFIATNLYPKNIQRLADGTFSIQTLDNEYIVDCIVNATGHGRHNSPIIEKMKADGLAEVQTKTGVLKTDQSGHRLTKSGVTCIGPAVHFGTDGIQTFAVQAEKFAAELIQSYT